MTAACATTRLRLVPLFTNQPVELAAGYAAIAVIALGAGAGLSLELRTLLAQPGHHEQIYYGTVTWHALVMIFAFMMPTLFGVVANALTPSIVGISDMLLPRLNGAGMWILAAAVGLMVAAQAHDAEAPVGWTLYPPLSETADRSTDLAIVGLHLAGVSSIVLAINLIITTYASQASRLSWDRIPLVLWATNTANVLLILTLPALAGAITMLLLDRVGNGGYYDVGLGGEPLLYQHLFWFFGHPEVYVLVLPCFGYTSHGMATELKGAVLNGHAMLLALMTIGSVSMVVYGHHLYTTGMDRDARSYFSWATYLVAIPTGAKYYTWIAALETSRATHSMPMHAVSGFLWYFAIGGFTGVVLADSALDAPLHDAYYVVAHFHLVMAVAIIYSLGGELAQAGAPLLG